jgi:uncharacterized membrane protein YphA (DoxX/SURF4 family)/thiol-disulfide isomerase/thioredoxin
MQSAVLAGRLLLAAVFLAAGIGKLLDREGSRIALADFGVPVRFIAPGAVALPLAELAIVVALVIAPSARVGAVAAAVMLLAFTLAIGNALIHHRAPDCHCFGQIHSAPAGGGTLTRNGLLLLLAAFVAWRGPGPALYTWVSQRDPGELALSAGIAALALLAAGGGYLVERRRRERAWAEGEEIRGRLGVPPGSSAPKFDLPGACGPSLSLDSLCARGRPVMVLFADLECCACEALLPHVGRWQETLADQLTIVLISNEDDAAGRSLCERYGIANVLLQSDFNVSNSYLTRGTPSAVIVGIDGVVASATATGYQMIHALVRVTLRRKPVLAEPQALCTQPA